MNYKKKYLKYKLKYLNLKKKFFGGMDCRSENNEFAKRILSVHNTLSIEDLARTMINEANTYDNIQNYLDEYRETLQKIGKIDEKFEKKMVDKLEKSINIIVEIYTTAEKTQNIKAEKAKQKAEEARIEADIAAELAEEAAAEAAEEAEEAEAAAEVAAETDKKKSFSLLERKEKSKCNKKPFSSDDDW